MTSVQTAAGGRTHAREIGLMKVRDPLVLPGTSMDTPTHRSLAVRLVRAGLLAAAPIIAMLPVDAAVAVKAEEAFRWATFFGPFHMVVLHYPIGFLTLAALLEVWATFRPAGPGRQALGLVLPLTAAASVATATLGWLRAGGGGFDPELLALHRWTGIAVAVLTVGACLMHRISGDRIASGTHRFGYRGSLGAALACLVIAGHFGGSLTHGEGFLTLNAPRFVRDLIAKGTTKPPVANGATRVSLYASVVRPAFEGKCYTCHGTEKQKGKFRLDQREALLKGGGSSEIAVTPGDIQKSRLMYHLLLPRDHDDAMPPKGKEPLTPAEIVAVAQWIQAGAKFE